MVSPLLLSEFILLFLVLPLAFRFSPVRLPALPLLWLVALYCWLTLGRDPTFPQDRLWNAAAVPAHLHAVLGLYALLGGLIVLGTRLFAPQLFCSFPRERPLLWLAVMLLYPVLSVYPQSLIYRAFLMHRYAPLVHGSAIALILLSAAAFGWLHLIFRNRLAVVLTGLGGLLFAWRYQVSGSLALSALEHALFGCLLFTVGLGQYFYSGAALSGTFAASADELPEASSRAAD
jgi:hypothetical protein